MSRDEEHAEGSGSASGRWHGGGPEEAGSSQHDEVRSKSVRFDVGDEDRDPYDGHGRRYERMEFGAAQQDDEYGSSDEEDGEADEDEDVQAVPMAYYLAQRGRHPEEASNVGETRGLLEPPHRDRPSPLWGGVY